MTNVFHLVVVLENLQISKLSPIVIRISVHMVFRMFFEHSGNFSICTQFTSNVKYHALNNPYRWRVLCDDVYCFYFVFVEIVVYFQTKWLHQNVNMCDVWRAYRFLIYLSHTQYLWQTRMNKRVKQKSRKYKNEKKINLNAIEYTSTQQTRTQFESNDFPGIIFSFFPSFYFLCDAEKIIIRTIALSIVDSNFTLVDCKFCGNSTSDTRMELINLI